MAEEGNGIGYDIGSSFHWFVVAIIGLLVVTFLVGWGAAASTSLTIYESMSVIGVLASIALTATLAYLYYRMSRIQNQQREQSVRRADLQAELANSQEKQNELLKLQQDMMKLEYQPKILIDEYELKPSGVELTLRNLGRGLAEHIAVRTNFHIPNLPEEQRSHDSDAAGENLLHTPDEVFYRDPETGTEYIPKTTLTVRTEGEAFLAKQRRGGRLSPDEGAVTFISDVRFGRVNQGQNGISGVLPSRLFELLHENGVREIRFYLDLVYCNELGEVFVSPIMGRSGKLTRETELENIEDLQYGSTGTRQEVRENIKKNRTYPPL